MDYYESGYRVVQWVQQWQNPVLDWAACGVSALGVKEFYLFAIPLAYWCVDKKFGTKLCCLFLFGIFVNTWAKHFVHTHRPSPTRVRVLYPESGGGYSFPSGHAQGSVAFWGYCMSWVKNRWFSLFSVCLIVAMCYSRLYLGVHFPWDVIGGALIGLATLIFFFVLLGLYGRIKNKVAWPAWLMVIAVSAVALAWLFPVERFALMIGCFLGFLSGVVLERRFVRCEMRREWDLQAKKAFLGFSIGFLITWGAMMGLKGMDPGALIAYALGSAWVSLGAPWCFKKLGWG